MERFEPFSFQADAIDPANFGGLNVAKVSALTQPGAINALRCRENIRRDIRG